MMDELYSKSESELEEFKFKPELEKTSVIYTIILEGKIYKSYLNEKQAYYNYSLLNKNHKEDTRLHIAMYVSHLVLDNDILSQLEDRTQTTDYNEEEKPPFSEDMKRIAADYFKLMIDKRDLEKEIELLKMENKLLKLKTGSLQQEFQNYVDRDGIGE